MKSGYYLAIPLIATLLDVLFGIYLTINQADGVVAQNVPAFQEIPATAESAKLPDSLYCVDSEGTENQVCGASDADADAGGTAVWSSSSKADEQDDDEEEDPMLQRMPNYDFKAYVRQDISAFYGEPPGSRTEKKPSFAGQAGKFVNMSPERLSLYWDGGRGDPRFIGYAGPFEATGTSTFPGHTFLFAPHGKPDEKVCVYNVVKGTSVYFFDPFTEDAGEPGRCKMISSEQRSLEELGAQDRLSYDQHRFNLEFAEDYRDFTGSEWLTLYPRDPPMHKIWRADYFGQTHTVETRETHFVELPPEELLPKQTMTMLRRNESDPVALREYRAEEPTMELTLTTVSCAPRAFEILDFLSEVEVDHILALAHRKKLLPSTTGSNSDKADTDTRTSTNTWVSRYSSPIVDAIYRRAADALRMDEALLRHRSKDEYPDLPSDQPLSEDLQTVHYFVSEQYTAHHDFGYTDGRSPNSPSRSINVLLYLNEGMEGGETSFPKWRNAETSDALDVTPVKGKAVIFYMRTPDGNLDDLTQHAALPVNEGEKWLANLWIWDPIKL